MNNQRKNNAEGREIEKRFRATERYFKEREEKLNQ